MSKKEISFEILKGIGAMVFWLILVCILIIILDPVWDYRYPFGADYFKYVFYFSGMVVGGYCLSILTIKLFYNED